MSISSQASPTWVCPYNFNGDLALAFASLSQWLATAPIFPNGITIGDPNNQGVFDPASGAMTTPPWATLLTAGVHGGQLAFDWDGTNLLVYYDGVLVKTL